MTVIRFLLFFLVITINVVTIGRCSNINPAVEKSYGVKTMKSKSGVNFLFRQDPDTQLVHIRIAFKYSGAAYQEKGKAGLANFFSSAIFCGCGEYSSVQLEREIENLSAILGCTASCDAITFAMTVPRLVLKKAVLLLNTILTKPAFEKDRLRLVQNSILAQLQNYTRGSVGLVSSLFIPSIIFESHPYGSGETGTAEDFAKLSVDDLHKYKADFINISNAEACIFGNISAEEATDVLGTLLNGVPVGGPHKDTVMDIDPIIKPMQKWVYEKTPQSTIWFVLKTAGYHSPKRYSADVLGVIFGKSTLFNSRIMSQLRTKEGLIYGGGCYILHLNHASYLLGVLKTENSSVPKTIELLKKIIEDLRVNGVTAEELDFAKSHLKGSAVVALGTSAGMCDFFFREMLHGGTETALDDLLNGISAVQLKEINAFAAETLDENNMLFVVIGGTE
ncbi:MAG: insulinase family protein [Holosporaceae bacterium]|jgi:zinc protease|nr:insulinase family protein [Holosporaceae bacterium]